MGIKVELEHTKNVRLPRPSRSGIWRDPHYYSKGMFPA